MTPDQTEIMVNVFNDARKIFPGKKKGNGYEFKNFIKRSTKPAPNGMEFNPEEVIQLLKKAIEYQIAYRIYAENRSIFTPPWKNFQTWINKNCWEDEYLDYDAISKELENKNNVGSQKISESEAKKFW